MKHAFEKSSRGLSSSCVDERGNVCGVCKNLWQLNVKSSAASKADSTNSSTNSSTNTSSSSYVCSNCDLMVHSSCRLIANETSPCCVYKGAASEMCTLRLESVSNAVVSTHSISVPGSSLAGKLYLSVLRAYNLNITEETQLYCMFRIGTGHQSIISPSATAKDNECIWNLVDDPDAVQSDMHLVTSCDPQKTYNVSDVTLFCFILL
jgi:hypothetical protein